MSYDFEDGQDRSAPDLGIKPMHPKDLEAIVMGAEIAGMFLHDDQGLFTVEELHAKMIAICDGAVAYDLRDLKIVLPMMKTIRRAGGGKYIWG